ncbi:hypothetical protein L6R52_05425 [Myxococcota bacterium]|nr:hypothetical protein [Myxococcota bacterium]
MSRTCRSAGLFAALFVGALTACPGGGETPPPARETIVSLDLETFTPMTATGAVVGPSGGVVRASGATGDVAVEIDVPAGAASEDVTFTVSVASVTSEAGLPEGAIIASRAFRIETSASAAWSEERMFDRPVEVTLPYDALTDPDDEKTVQFYRWGPDGALEPAGFSRIDRAARTISFYTRSFGSSAEPSRLGGTSGLTADVAFATYVAVAIGQRWAAFVTGGGVVDSGFRAAKDGWFIPNYGAYYKKSRGGSCFGFVGGAKYYYRRQFSPTLFENYRDAAKTATWLDDEVAIELTSRIHNGLAEIWSTFLSGELDAQVPSSEDVALSYLGALYVTGMPALLYIQQKTIDAAGAAHYTGAHAIMIYRADVGAGGAITFWVYDPNFPGKDDRRITWGAGGFASYASGTDAASSSFQYNYFKHVGYHVGLGDSVLDALKAAADRKFEGDTVFPEITITEVRGVDGSQLADVATEDVTARGERCFVVPEAAVQISGTVLGGLAQDACCVVDNVRVFVDNRRYSARVNNQAGGGDGKFSIIVPVAQGDNEIVLLAAKRNSFSNWAGFHRDLVRSNASPAAVTVTLSWSQDASDVDLYVREPSDDATGKVGDTVYFGHRNGTAVETPYLDFDNTQGYGPEHYYGLDGMHTQYTDYTPAEGLYGDYTARVHYYSDHKCSSLSGEEYEACRAEPPQVITWSLGWRFLAYCPEPCTEPDATGFWVEGSSGGSLATPAAGNCCNIDNTGGDWSSPITIHYPRPRPEDWVVPPSSTVMLP